MGRESDAPLFPAALFEYENRPKRDGFFGVAYVVSLLAVIVGGLFSFVHRNPQYNKLTSDAVLNDPHSCPLNAPGRRRLLEGPLADDFELSALVASVIVWAVASFVASTVLGVLFLRLFQRKAEAMVYFTVAFKTALPLVAGVVLCSLGAVAPGVALLFAGVIIGFCFYLWRDRFPLVARLISVAATGLGANPAIMWVVVALQFGLALVNLPLIFSMFAALENGALVPNPDRAPAGNLAAPATTCYAADGSEVACCVFQPDGWVPFYLAFAALMLMWTSFLAFEVKVFTISGTIGQWYFAPVSATSFRGNTLRSLKHAFGPSFGTLALGSGVLTLCEILKNAARERGNSNGGLVGCILRCIVACIASFLELITKFATTRAAITGEAFFSASRNIVDLLKRNFLNTIGVWWLPAVILQTTCAAIALVVGLSAGAATYTLWATLHRAQPGLASFVIGLLAFFITTVTLSFFASVLLNVIDAVYICYAMDRDAQLCTKPAIHEVYSQVPNISTATGPIVEDPDGEVRYGAPVRADAEPSTQGTYVPPAVAGAGSAQVSRV